MDEKRAQNFLITLRKLITKSATLLDANNVPEWMLQNDIKSDGGITEAVKRENQVNEEDKDTM